MVRKRKIKRSEEIAQEMVEEHDDHKRSHGTSDKMFAFFVGGIMILSAVALGFNYFSTFDSGGGGREGAPEGARFLFDWERVPGEHSPQLRTILEDVFGFSFASEPSVMKSEDGLTITYTDGNTTATLTLEADQELVSLNLQDGQEYLFKLVEDEEGRAVYATSQRISRPQDYEIDLSKFLDTGGDDTPPEAAEAYFVPATIKGRLPSLVFFGTQDENTTLTRQEVIERVRGVRGVANVTEAPAEKEEVLHLQLFLDLDHILDQNLTAELAGQLEALGEELALETPAVYQPSFAELDTDKVNMTLGGENKVITLRNKLIYSMLTPPVEENATVQLMLRGKVVGSRPHILADGREDMMGFQQAFTISLG